MAKSSIVLETVVAVHRERAGTLTREYGVTPCIDGTPTYTMVVVEWQRTLYILTTRSRMSRICMYRTRSNICMMKLRSSKGHICMIRRRRFQDP